MNCLEARRVLLGNPVTEDTTLRLHLRSCASCHTFANELRQHENLFKKALDVPVPPRLAERILLNIRLRQPPWHRYATAVVVLLVITTISVGRYMLPQQEAPDRWSEVVLAHVLNERDTLEKDEQVPADNLRKALEAFGLTLKGKPIHIRYLDRCEMPGGKGLHVVIDTPELGQVTLIIPPRGTSADGSQSGRDGFVSTLVQVGDTAIGIVTQQPDYLRPLSHWLKTALAST